jgi:hypothetical protein
MITAQELVAREVKYCVSRLVSALAEGIHAPESHNAQGTVLGDLAWQAVYLSAPIATDRPLEIDDRDSVKEYFACFGAWDREEIAAWSAADLDALVLQYASGDLREVQSLCPGEGLADVDWTAAEELAQEGTIGGHLYVSDGNLFIELSD